MKSVESRMRENVRHFDRNKKNEREKWLHALSVLYFLCCVHWMKTKRWWYSYIRKCRQDVEGTRATSTYSILHAMPRYAVYNQLTVFCSVSCRWFFNQLFVLLSVCCFKRFHCACGRCVYDKNFVLYLICMSQSIQIDKFVNVLWVFVWWFFYINIVGWLLLLLRIQHSTCECI